MTILLAIYLIFAPIEFDYSIEIPEIYDDIVYFA